MAYPLGGLADKIGNHYETEWLISKFLDVIEEKIESVITEGVGEDEKGIDLWINYFDGIKEGQQCKGRNSSLEQWDFGSFNKKGIWKNWKYQLDRSNSIRVSLISPISFTQLDDILLGTKTINNNPRNFYEYKIKNAGERTKSLFNNICRVLELDPNDEEDLVRVFDYLSRMSIKTIPEYSLHENNCIRIERLFVGNPDDVYGYLLKYASSNEVFGNNINYNILDAYIKECGLEYSNLSKDNRVRPVIQELNGEFKASFMCMPGGFLLRKEVNNCLDELGKGNSIIIHGCAGVGKTGCAEGLVQSLEKHGIEYLAIKLDTHIPLNNSEKWAESMGFPASIPRCIDAITKDMTVVIFDQLDALRWTHSHSGDALTITISVIKEIQSINKTRENPICMVFVCRTYDLNNDSSIAALFAENNNWKKIEVSPLDDRTLSTIIGNSYDSMPPKLKKLLSIPSNLYIWDKINNKEVCNGLSATYQLVDMWWEQITFTCKNYELESKVVDGIKDDIVNKCFETSAVYAPKSSVSIPGDYQKFLLSSGIIRIENQSISFVHQSILDCFFAQEMCKRYYDHFTVIDIIGNRNRQTPSRRYQTQLFMQRLLDESEKAFLLFGKELLLEPDIRYSFKILFFEILSQIEYDSKNIDATAIKLVQDPNWKAQAINVICFGSLRFVHLLVRNGIMEKMIEDDKTSKFGIELLASIREHYNEEDVLLIAKYIDDSRFDSQIFWLFPFEFHQDIDSLFELRLKIYTNHPERINRNFDLVEMMRKCENRTIRILELMIKNISPLLEQQLYRDTKDFYYDDLTDLVTDYNFVIRMLLPLIPTSINLAQNRCWSPKYSSMYSMERTCVSLVKTATRMMATYDPEAFFDCFKTYFGKHFSILDEIILDGMNCLNESYSDWVIKYISNDSFKNSFCDASESGDRLLYTKRLVERFSPFCSDTVLTSFVTDVIHYIDPIAKEILKSRIDNTYKRGFYDDTPFWGSFQYEILPSISVNRRNSEVSELIGVLSRRNTNGYYSSNFDEIDTESIYVSPLENKELSLSQWIRIITNAEKLSRDYFKLFRRNGINICHNPTDYVRDFSSYVEKKPDEIIEYMCDESTTNPLDVFVETFISAVANTNAIVLNENQIIALIKRFGSENSERTLCFLSMIEKSNIENGIDYIVEYLWKIIDSPIKYDDKFDYTKIREEDFSTYISSAVYSSARARAIVVFSKLLANNEALYFAYSDRIAKLTSDDSETIRYASLYILNQIYGYMSESALKMIIEVFEKNPRFLCFFTSRYYLFEYCKINVNKTKELIANAMEYDDERIYTNIGYVIVDMYFYDKNLFDIIDIYKKANDVFRFFILEMIVAYYKEKEYRQTAKQLLLSLADVGEGLEQESLWRRLFDHKIVDLEEDFDLVSKIMHRSVAKYLLESFSKYVLAERKLKLYSNLVFDSAEQIMENRNARSVEWGIYDVISRLIIQLYDEASNGLENEDEVLASKCLDIWDKMYEYDLGAAKRLTNQMQEM